MRYGFVALALTAFIAFAATPVLADCAGHTKTAAEISAPTTTVAVEPVKQSTPVGG